MRIDKFWIVTRPTNTSILQDIAFETDVVRLALQMKGGLGPGEIEAAFTEQREAETLAEELLHARAEATGGSTDLDGRVRDFLWDAITESRLRDKAKALLDEMLAKPE